MPGDKPAITYSGGPTAFRCAGEAYGWVQAILESPGMIDVNGFVVMGYKDNIFVYDLCCRIDGADTIVRHAVGLKGFLRGVSPHKIAVGIVAAFRERISRYAQKEECVVIQKGESGVDELQRLKGEGP